MRTFTTDQERFWAGKFGTDYVKRNKTENLLSSNVALFSKILRHATGVRSVLEFGSNIGLNLMAIRQLIPCVKLSAIEINPSATAELRKIKDIKVYPQSILAFQPDYPRDLVLVKGVLIHMAPERLSQTYDLLHQCAGRFLCVVEYYNPTPVEIPYRGHKGKLFKRDFAGELLERFRDLHLRDYGFVYHRDPSFPQDDLTWFLLEKRTSSMSPEVCS